MTGLCWIEARRLQLLLPKEQLFMKHVIKSLILASAAAVVLAPIQARADGFEIGRAHV